MRHLSTIFALIGVVLLLAFAGCRNGSESGEHEGGSESSEHESGPETGEGDEESGIQFGKSDVFDQVRAGARLVLSYDSSANAFTGTVENTTGATLKAGQGGGPSFQRDRARPDYPCRRVPRPGGPRHSTGVQPALHHVERTPGGRLTLQKVRHQRYALSRLTTLITKTRRASSWMSQMTRQVPTR